MLLSLVEDRGMQSLEEEEPVSMPRVVVLLWPGQYCHYFFAMKWHIQSLEVCYDQ